MNKLILDQNLNARAENITAVETRRNLNDHAEGLNKNRVLEIL
jgi:hypothetical protein